MQAYLLLGRFFLGFSNIVARFWRAYAIAPDGISGAADSVYISIGGRPVVSDTRFSQPISAV